MNITDYYHRVESMATSLAEFMIQLATDKWSSCSSMA